MEKIFRDMLIDEEKFFINQQLMLLKLNCKKKDIPEMKRNLKAIKEALDVLKRYVVVEVEDEKFDYFN